jgi:hypothetical protein
MRKFLSRALPAVLLAGLVLWPGAYCPGLHSSTDFAKSSQAGQTLGAQIMRVEFPVCSTASSLDAAFTTFANRGIRVLPLAGFHGAMPSQACAAGLGSWADRFGNGGTFWASYGGTDLPVSHIEFGNETSYAHQYPSCTSQNPGAWWSVPCYTQRARDYATRAAEAIFAIVQSNPDVKLLVQADHGGSGSPNWVNSMFDAVPNLGDLVGGWTVHPYGPNYASKINALVAHTAANGAPATVPVDVTEYGLSSDNGRALSDNYGWPTNQTYAQAAAALDSANDGMRALLGDRLQHFIVYNAHDLQPTGSTTNREAYFGGLQSNLAAKGAYTTEVQATLAGD